MSLLPSLIKSGHKNLVTSDKTSLFTKNGYIGCYGGYMKKKKTRGQNINYPISMFNEYLK